MDIISYRDFSDLRLKNFIANAHDIQAFGDFEFMGAVWYCERIGFTEWLQLAPGSGTKSISLDFSSLPDLSIHKILSTLRLDLQKGMTIETVVALLGEPQNIEIFVKDRVTYQYVIGSQEKYYLALTIQNKEGLTYLVIMNHLDSINTLEEKISS